MVTEDRIRVVWSAIGIELLRQKSGKRIDEMLLPPAELNAVDDLEKNLHVILPADYKRSLSIHEGTEYWVWLWDAVSLGDLNYVFTSWRDNIKESSHPSQRNTKLIPHGQVRDCMFDALWIPVAANNGIPICLDLNPAPGGKLGQVIYVDWEDGTVKVIASSFLEFLENGLKKMQLGS
jgi:cell wall assembly regulator SMI1